MNKKVKLQTVCFAVISLLSLSASGAPKVEDPFKIRAGQEPTTLNPIVADRQAVAPVHSLILETLLQKDEQTYEWRGGLAERWEVSADGRRIDFFIRKDAKWSDGQPITAQDVKFSFDMIFDSRYPLAQFRPYFSAFEDVQAIDTRHVRYRVKTRYFGNLIAAATMTILPKHVYGDPEHSKTIYDQVIGSGPYRVERWNHGRNIVLVKNANWWGREVPAYKNMHRAERVAFYFVTDDNMALEMLRRGQLDFSDLSPELYIRVQENKADARKFNLQRVSNRYPGFVNAIALNLKNPLFSDRRVRQALAMLVDRKTMVDKFFHGFSSRATGPWYLQSEFADSSVPATDYDPEAAAKLLREAGWRDDGKQDVLVRDTPHGTIPFRFTVITSTPKAMRHLSFFKEDAAKLGVDVDVRLVPMGTFSKLMEERSFEAADLGWAGGPVEFDPRSGWHSESAQAGGLNFVGYNNPRADRLLDQIRTVFDFKSRVAPMRELYRTIAADIPFIFMFNENSTFYAYSKRVGRARPFFAYDSGLRFMFLKAPESKGDLRADR